VAKNYSAPGLFRMVNVSKYHALIFLPENLCENNEKKYSILSDLSSCKSGSTCRTNCWGFKCLL